MYTIFFGKKKILNSCTLNVTPQKSDLLHPYFMDRPCYIILSYFLVKILDNLGVKGKEIKQSMLINKEIKGRVSFMLI